VTHSAPEGQPTTVNLGGGFVYLRRVDGHSAVVASGLADTGAIGIMSAADVDARRDDELRKWLQWWAFPDHARLRRVNQVHGGTVVDAASYNGGAPDADGMWTRSPADLLVVRAADCAPVWVVDPVSRAIAVVHAGWRGIAAGVVENAVRALRRAGAHPEDLHVAVGPHIGPCCFEVGPEVAEAFARDGGAILPPTNLVVQPRRSDGVVLDLSAAIARRLAEEGVNLSRAGFSTACTRCRDDILHSYRRNGTGGPLMAAVGAVLA
jgi:YfiH family protein